jgi:hypothetical protein
MQLDDTFQGLVRKMLKIEPAAVTKYERAGLNDLIASANGDAMRTPVHLPLFSWRMINGRTGDFDMRRTDRADIIFQDRIPARIPQLLDLFQYPHGGELLFLDQITDFRLVGVEESFAGLPG